MLLINTFYKWTNLGYKMVSPSLPLNYPILATTVLFPRYTAFPAPPPTTPWSGHSLSSRLHIFQQYLLSKIYLQPHHCRCHHQTPIWISHKIEASTTTTNKDLHQVLPPPWIHVLHLLCWWRWRALPIGRFHETMFWTWGHCWNHWCICLINKQESGISPPDH